MDELQNVENMVETVENHAESPMIDYEALYNQSADTIKELTAERDSLKSENDELRQAKEQAIADGAKAREMNYTLSRQLNVAGAVEKSTEELFAEAFLSKGD